MVVFRGLKAMVKRSGREAIGITIEMDTSRPDKIRKVSINITEDAEVGRLEPKPGGNGIFEMTNKR